MTLTLGSTSEIHCRSSPRAGAITTTVTPDASSWATPGVYRGPARLPGPVAGHGAVCGSGVAVSRWGDETGAEHAEPLTVVHPVVDGSLVPGALVPAVRRVLRLEADDHRNGRRASL